jgi:hypothetical protein
VDERSEAGNARMANFMLEVGVPKAFVDFALMAGPHWITTFNHHQAMSWGLLDSPPPHEASGCTASTRAQSEDDSNLPPKTM